MPRVLESRVLLLPALALLASLAPAQDSSFDAQLHDARQAIFQTLQDQRSAIIEEAARQTQTLDGAVGQLRWVVQDLRRRAAWIDRSRGRDWFFEADLQQLRHDLQNLSLRAKSLDSNVARLARETEPDPALGAAVSKLAQAARGLRVESGRLADDGRWAGHELSRAGYQSEGEDLASWAKNTLMSAFHIEDAAKRLQRRTTP